MAPEATLFDERDKVESSQPLVVSRVQDPAQLPCLAAAWDRLDEDGRPGRPFRSGAWLVPWWTQFSAGTQLCLYVARRGTDLVGVLPGYRRRTPTGGEQFRLLGDGVVTSDYLGVIARPDDLEAASAAIGRALLEHEDDIALEGIEIEEPIVKILHREAKAAGAVRALSTLGPSPVLTLDHPGGYEGWLRDHPRANPGRRRKRRPLERRPGFRIDVLTEEHDAAEGLVALWRLHRLRWAEEGGSAALTGARVEQFHDQAGRALARRGWLRIHVLHVEGAPRAARYVIEEGGRAYDYQSGRDPAWDKRSVGSVLLDATIEDAFARGLRELDFLRGDEPFKRLYTSEQRTMVEIRVATSARARAVIAASRGWDAARQAARTALPPEACAWLRRGEVQIRRWIGSDT